MGFNFNFRQIDSTRDIRSLIDFISKQGLDYPSYLDWVSRCEAEIYEGYKNAILAFSEGKLVGNIIFQQHKQMGQALEIKNLRVDPSIRRRDFGHFMLQQLKAEANQSKKYGLIICDTRASQKDIISLVEFSGFREIARTPLYDSNEEDVILTLPLKKEGSIFTTDYYR